MQRENELEVLLVEDTATDAEMTIMALKENNLASNIVWVKDGREALDFIFAGGANGHLYVNRFPKVILLDLRLPNVDGIEVLRAIKSDERTKTIPVVVLTTSEEDRDIVESYKLGVNSYINKPVNFDHYVQMVKDLGLYWLLLNKPPR